ncbi:hypothetical protein F383_35958 [Gossypium arboreum]|uniref:Uncharacterized protein n=1 Tax=Gossypium arboreum TaxID=29729 RepID=A0A0B0NAG7_GOSAR|nr:hypothetical protein F383_35958 [Gossypium arboreum]
MLSVGSIGAIINQVKRQGESQLSFRQSEWKCQGLFEKHE